MGAAVVLAMCNFVFAYSKTSKRVVSRIHRTSNVMATAAERER
jgi:hypothetical protein